MNCPRCGICHKDNDEANKTGGHGYIYNWESGLCPICRDRKREYEQKANRWLADRTDG